MIRTSINIPHAMLPEPNNLSTSWQGRRVPNHINLSIWVGSQTNFRHAGQWSQILSFEDPVCAVRGLPAELETSLLVTIPLPTSTFSTTKYTTLCQFQYNSYWHTSEEQLTKWFGKYIVNGQFMSMHSATKLSSHLRPWNVKTITAPGETWRTPHLKCSHICQFGLSFCDASRTVFFFGEIGTDLQLIVSRELHAMVVQIWLSKLGLQNRPHKCWSK